MTLPPRKLRVQANARDHLGLNELSRQRPNRDRGKDDLSERKSVAGSEGAKTDVAGDQNRGRRALRTQRVSKSYMRFDVRQVEAARAGRDGEPRSDRNRASTYEKRVLCGHGCIAGPPRSSIAGRKRRHPCAQRHAWRAARSIQASAEAALELKRAPRSIGSPA
jgi:hypothetical protein